MAGLYCDITLLASVGKETATNTISRQAILYSSSGLMFSEDTNRKGGQTGGVCARQTEFVRVCVRLTALLRGQSHHQSRVNLTG